MRRIIVASILVCSFMFASERYLDVPILSPYLGYHTMTDSRDLNSAWEFGVNLSKKFSNNINIEGTIGLIPTKIRSSQTDRWNLALAVNGVYEFGQIGRVVPYALGGVGSDIGYNAFLGLNVGLGLKWKMNNYFHPRLEVKNIYYTDNRGFDTVVSVILTWPPIVNELEEMYKVTGKVEKLNMRINFETDKTNIAPEYLDGLESYAVFMKNHPDLKMSINGYTDDVGLADYNVKLSKARADSVAKALIGGYGISKDRIKTEGFGSASPVASNETEEGRAKNRRIEASTYN